MGDPEAYAGDLADGEFVRGDGGAAPPFLAVEGLVASRGSRTVLDGVSFAVGRGESWAFSGRMARGRRRCPRS